MAADFRRKQAFEKLVSGMYLGEITRNMLLFLIDSSVLFDGYTSSVLNTHYGFDTSFVSHVEGAKTDDDVREGLIKQLKIDPKHIKDSDIELVRWACGLVAKRASYLAATAIAAIYLHTKETRKETGQERVDVGVDGR